MEPPKLKNDPRYKKIHQEIELIRPELSDDPRYKKIHQEEETCQINILFKPVQQFYMIQVKKGNEKFSNIIYWNSSTDEDEDEDDNYTPIRFEGTHIKPLPFYYDHSKEEWYSSSSSDSDDDDAYVYDKEEEKSDFLADSLLLELENTIEKIVNELKKKYNRHERAAHRGFRSSVLVIKSTYIGELKKKIEEKVRRMGIPVDITVSDDDPEKMSLNFKRGHESSLRQVCVEYLEKAKRFESEKEQLKKQNISLEKQNISLEKQNISLEKQNRRLEKQNRRYKGDE